MPTPPVDTGELRAAFFPCHQCALDGMDVESIVWHWPHDWPGALCFCLVHAPAHLMRDARWQQWFAWIGWNPLYLEREPVTELAA